MHAGEVGVVVGLGLDQQRACVLRGMVGHDHARVVHGDERTDGEPELLVVTPRPEARDRLDDLHVVCVVAARAGRQHAELGQPVQDVGGQIVAPPRLRHRHALALALLDRALDDAVLDHAQGHEAVLLQPLDEPDALDVLGRVVGHVARGAHDLVALTEQSLAQVVLDRPRADARALGQLAHLQKPGLVHDRNGVGGSSSATGPAAAAPDSSSAAISCAP